MQITSAALFVPFSLHLKAVSTAAFLPNYNSTITQISVSAPLWKRSARPAPIVDEQPLFAFVSRFSYGEKWKISDSETEDWLRHLGAKCKRGYGRSNTLLQPLEDLYGPRQLPSRQAMYFKVDLRKGLDWRIFPWVLEWVTKSTIDEAWSSVFGWHRERKFMMSIFIGKDFKSASQGGPDIVMWIFAGPRGWSFDDMRTDGMDYYEGDRGFYQIEYGPGPRAYWQGFGGEIAPSQRPLPSKSRIRRPPSVSPVTAR